uniref:C2H2-type domain-containing protein n=1 Tax=Panagrolaimus sp. JU765 TaxID=591449 RepID=A0AC34Q2E2_9BILA
MDARVKQRVERLLKSTRLKKHTIKKLKNLKREKLKRDKLDSHEIFCSICGEMFQKRHFDDYREHMAMHEAVDFIWGLKTEEINGSFNNLTPEIVQITPEQYKLYIDGRKTQIIKELKETAEYEAGVRFRQNGGRTVPVPVVEMGKRPQATFPKIIMPASKPTLPRPPVTRHMTPNRPYYGAPFMIKPAMPSPKQPCTFEKNPSPVPKESTSDGISRHKGYPVIQVAPNHPSFGRPPPLQPISADGLIPKTNLVRFMSLSKHHEPVTAADIPTTSTASTSKATSVPRYIIPAQRPHGIFPNPGARKIVRNVVPVRANGPPFQLKKDIAPVKMFEGMPLRPSSACRLSPPLLHPMSQNSQESESASSSTSSTPIPVGNGSNVAKKKSQVPDLLKVEPSSSRSQKR